MSLLKPETVYVTYIAAPAEKVWAALTRGEFTKQYFFGRRIESDWKKGSAWTLWMEDGRADCSGQVLESDPPRRLSLSWHVEWLEEYRRLPPGVVTYELRALDGVTKLTVSEQHDDSLPEKFRQGGRDGWPVILCGLKTLVETGAPMPAFDMARLMPKPG